MIVEPFAGPGGWDEGLRALGRTDVLGIELDPAACATRAAAGHRTIRADVAELPIRPFVGKVEGLIASPPCQQFSSAGGGEARAELDITADILRNGHPWWGPDGPQSDGARHILNVGEWIEWTRPGWIALEQVPPVLALWEAMADWLRDEGYRCWTGILNAADYGVPQTRERAFLLASLAGPATPPAPTHAKHPQASLFGPERRPWVSMADALGWPEFDWGWERHNGQRRSHSTTQPAPTVCGARQPGWTRARSGWKLRTGNSTQQGRQPGGLDRPASEPARTVDSRSDQWVWERPATTIAGDPRCWPPGHKINADDRARHADADERYGDRAGADAIRLTQPEALVLQSFQPDYPVQGTKTKQFEQIGNAVPPLLAAHVLAAVTGDPLSALDPAA